MAKKPDVADLVKKLAKKHKGLLISILEDLQEHYNYLPEDVLKVVAEELDIPLRDVYGVATFYHAFSLKPRGKHCLTVCLGTACHVRGGARIADVVSHRLNIKPGETTEDKQFTLETVNCLGACALGPVIILNKKSHGNMTPGNVELLLKKCAKKK